jgi:hypothetical protein
MRRIKSLLVLLLAFTMIAISVSTPAAHAVSMSGSSGTTLGGGATTASTSGSQGGNDSGQGDPGGAGDGLGADLTNASAGTGQVNSASVALEFMLQLLRLLQAAG